VPCSKSATRCCASWVDGTGYDRAPGTQAHVRAASSPWPAWEPHTRDGRRMHPSLLQPAARDFSITKAVSPAPPSAGWICTRWPAVRCTLRNYSRHLPVVSRGDEDAGNDDHCQASGRETVGPAQLVSRPLRVLGYLDECPRHLRAGPIGCHSTCSERCQHPDLPVQPRAVFVSSLTVAGVKGEDMILVGGRGTQTRSVDPNQPSSGIWVDENTASLADTSVTQQEGSP
jgi:hypothetical protein